MPNQAPANSTGYRADIEGLRGIAILMVVGFHCGLSAMAGGFLGVDSFFVISGYVITRLLVREATDTGTVSLLEFYARRVRRLLPAATVVLLATSLAGAALLAPNELLFTARAARATAVYASNFFFALNTADYFSPDVAINPLLHTWSLGVEEQFYLFWPLLLLVCYRSSSSRRRLAIALGTVTVASFVVSVLLTDRMGSFGFYTLPTRVWQFGVGALACLAPVSRLKVPAAWWNVVGLVGLALLGVSTALLSDHVSIPGWVAIVPVFGTAAPLISGAAAPGVFASRLLGVRPLKYVGLVSYGWYLWHWPFIVFAQAILPTSGVPGKILAAAGSFVAAALSRRYIESPARQSRALIARPWGTLGLGALATALTLVTATLVARYAVQLGHEPQMRALTEAIGDTGRLSRKDCVSAPETTEVKRCDFGADDALDRIALFGDSHAMQWFNPLDSIVVGHGWHLTTFVKSGCPSIDVAPPSHSAQAQRNCRSWQQRALEDVIALRPTLVIMTNATSHFGGVGLVASHVDFDDSLHDLEEGTHRTLERLSSAGIAVAIIRDIPRLPFDVPTCLARSLRHEWYRGDQCALVRSVSVSPAVFAAEKAAATGISNVYFIDLIDLLCDATRCPTMRGDTVLYRDNHHLTARYAESFAPALDTQLSSVVRALERAR